MEADQLSTAPRLHAIAVAKTPKRKDPDLKTTANLRYYVASATSEFQQKRLTHICETLHIFQSMRWGQEDSIVHYLDLGSASLGLTLFPLGYCLHAVTTRKGR